jgi:hypothetical protein
MRLAAEISRQCSRVGDSADQVKILKIEGPDLGNMVHGTGDGGYRGNAGSKTMSI